MLAFIGGVLVLIATLGFIVALIGLIRPNEKLGVGTRKEAGQVLAGALFFGVVGSFLLPDSPTPADATAQKPGQPAAALTPAAQSKLDRAATERAVLATWQSVITAVAPCDQANERVGKVVGSMSNGDASIYDAYSRAEEGAQACETAASTLNGLSTPEGVAADAEGDFSKALEMCRGAYTLRGTSLETAKDIFNGDFRPSIVGEYRQQAEAAQGGVMGCVAGYMSAAMKAGVDPQKLQGKS